MLNELYRYPTFYDIDFKDSGVPVLKIVNISKDGTLNSFTEGEYDYIDESVSKKFPRTILKEDDLVMAVRGATIGKIAVVPKHFENANINANLIRISLKNEKILPKYFWTYFNSNVGQSLFSQQVANTAKQTITVPQIIELLVPLPPIEIQKEIADRIDSAYDLKKQKLLKADEIIKKIDSIIAEKIGFKFPAIECPKAYAVKLSDFDNRLDPHFYLPGFKALIDNIRKINHSQLRDVVEFSGETWNQKDLFGNEFPYIEISEINLTSGKIENTSYIPISEAPSRARMVVRTNDIIVSTTRPNRGAIAFINEQQNGFIASTGFAVLRKLLRTDITKEYLFYILRTQICLQQMLQRSSGGSYPAITIEELKKIYIPIPSLEIQAQVVDEIKTCIDKAEALKAEANQYWEKTKQEIETIILS